MRKKKNKTGAYIWYGTASLAMLFIAIKLPSKLWLQNNLQLGGQIIITTSVASFIGYLIEERNWSQFMKRFTKPLTNWAHLPGVSATAIFSSFFSLVTANSMLTSAYLNKELSRLQLHVSAMCTSFMSYLYHSLRIMYPTIATIGFVGACYFGLLFGLGLMVVLLALLLSKHRTSAIKQEDKAEQIENNKPTDSWELSFRKAIVKTTQVLKRMCLVAIPMFLFFSFLSEIGFFDISQDFFHSTGLEKFFPVESVAVASAMMGGILSAATVAAGFMKTGELQPEHVLLALIAGNIISLPIRSLRRSLPSAMSVFPAKEALRIVLLNQGSRFISNLILLISMMLLMSKGLL